MFAPAASEQVSKSNLQRSTQQGGDGLQRALAGTPVQMLLMLQRTVGNQAVNQLLRQYKSSRQPAPGLIMPAVQRCGGTSCNCSPKEKAAHAQVRQMEEDQGQAASTITLPSLQRDVDSDDENGTGDTGAAPAEQGAATANADGGSSGSAAETDDTTDQSAEQPALDSTQGASATDDASAPRTGDDSDTAASSNDSGGDEQSATDTDQGDGGLPADAADSDDADADAPDLTPIPEISGEEDSHDEDVFGGSMDVQGKTHASYIHKFTMPTIIPTPGDASSCSCDAKNCVHISGTMTSTFTMKTDVSLPTPPDGLTDRQKQMYQNLIDTCISPHEQQHVAAFKTYEGTEQTPFDLTCCRADVHSSLQTIHDGVEKTRHDAAKSASEGLDPFLAKFDRSCAADADQATCTTCPPSKA